MAHKDKPETVEPGQRWEDADRRTRSGEFTVVAVVEGDGEIKYRGEPDPELVALVEDLLPRVIGSEETDYAVVQRGPGLHRVIKTSRLLEDDETRGYYYLGMDR